MEKTCNTCQHRNSQGICTNHDSVFFGCRVDDGDADYADGKLSKRYEQIMGDDAYYPAEQK